MPDRWNAVLRDRRRLASCLAGVTAGVAVIAFFLALGSGVRAALRSDIFPADRLRLEPAGGGRLAGLLPAGGKAPLVGEDAVTALRALPGVVAAYPRMRLAFPARAWGGREVLGEDMWTEVIGDGIPPEMVAGACPLFAETPAPVPGRPCSLDADCPGEEYCLEGKGGGRCARPVPFLVSRRLIEIYNSAVAASHGTPEVSDWLIGRAIGLRIHLGLGESSLGRARIGEPREVSIAFAGVSPEAAEIGISVPIAEARRWNEEFAGPEAAAGYSGITVVLDGGESAAPVAVAARGLGLEVVSRAEERIGVAIVLFEAVLAALGLLLLAVSTMNVVNAFHLTARERRREIALARAVGATRADVALDFLAGGAAVGGLGAAAGICLAVALAMLADLAAALWLPDFPFKPDGFFDFTPAATAACAVLGIASGMVGSLLPAVRATREDPARVLL